MFKGLSEEEVNRRLTEFGYNDLPSSSSKNIWQIILDLIREPMLLLLISCGVLYFILGDQTEGSVLLSSIFIIIGITFFQHRKTEKALEALKKLSSPRVLVIREGIESRIPGRELVPGDIIIVNQGDRIAADSKILLNEQLILDESLLTGESFGVRKTGDDLRLFSGTMVTSGKGIAEVQHTGLHAQIGQIASSIKVLKSGETRLQTEMKSFIKILGLISILICVAVVVLFYISRGNLYQSILNGLAAAMAILPEEFPVVLTIFLALGAWRLSFKHVLTRKPAVIETLGSATVLCSDKTGTITKNEMSVAAVFNGSEILERSMFSSANSKISEIMQYAVFASDQKVFDPMEKAMFALSDELAANPEKSLKLIKEYAFDQETTIMTRVFEEEKSGDLLIASKGAPEKLLEYSSMEQEEMEQYISALDKLAEAGYRIIAIAAGETDDGLPESQLDFDFRILGLLAMQDPIREEVPEAMQQCRDAGVRVIMMTGDYALTAKSIGNQCKLKTERILTGTEIELFEDDELAEELKNVDIIARVKPAHKLRIVQALQANGEVVAMTGDGINDAPALKASNIGIAMGKKGTDVAREASDLVLLDDNFASIVSAIRAGRKIYDNLQKAMSYIISIHIPIIGLTLYPAFFSAVPVLLMPLHIVFMELIIDPICSVAFESEQEEKGLMNKPPRDNTLKFFTQRSFFTSIFNGFLILTSVLVLYNFSLSEGHSEGQIRTICFTNLILGNIFLILTRLSRTRSFLSVFREPNLPALLIIGIALIVLGLTTFVPGLRTIFSFEYTGFNHLIPALIASGGILLVLEGIKYINYLSGRTGLLNQKKKI